MTVSRRDIESIGRPKYTFHTREDYFDTLSADIARQKSGNVCVSTMGYDSRDPQVWKVTNAMMMAAMRGVQTTFAVDNFASLDKMKIGPVGNHASGGKRDIDTLSGWGIYAAHANYPTIAGMQHVFPSGVYTGRSHIKSAVVNDRLYLGGMSMDATDRLDAMVSFVHPELAATVRLLNVRATISSIRYALSDTDQVLSFHEPTQSQLLIDAGVRGQSVIFDEALSIVDSAEDRLTYVSEQFPNGKIGAHLLRAYERGVDVTIAMNHPNNHDRYRFVHRAIIDAAKKKYPSEFFENQLSEDAPTLHTKAIASESRAMVGSHNLNRIGVMLGTAEMDVASSDVKFVKNTEALILDQIRDHSANK